MTTTNVVIPYSNKSPTYLVPVVILGVLSLCIVTARIQTRLRRTGKLHWDDKLILIAELLSICSIGIAIGAASHGWGKPMSYFTPGDLRTTIKLNFALQTVWLVTYSLVRLSVICSLLRFGTERAWRWPLYFMMGLQLVIPTGYFITQFSQCKPISANWGAVPGTVCWPLQPIIRLGWVVASIYIVTDLILSLFPIRLVYTLHRSTSEKTLICVMSLGLVATAIACAKLSTFSNFGKGDIMQATMNPSMWAKLEEQVGIIASSAPCLKGPVELCLRKLGILKEHQLTRPSVVMTGTTGMPTWKDRNQQIHTDDDSNVEGGKGNVRIDSAAVNKDSNMARSSSRNQRLPLSQRAEDSQQRVET